MKKIVALMVAGLLAGCSKSETPATEATSTNQPPAQQSSITKIVEDMSGASNIRAGRKAQDKIREISAEHDKDLEEAMGK